MASIDRLRGWSRSISSSLLVLAVVVAVCVGWTPAEAAAEGQLVIADWGGQNRKVLQKVAAGFEPKFNVRITWVAATAAENAAKVIATRNKPEYDLVMTENVYQHQMSVAGVLAPLDPNIVTALKDVLPMARTPKDDGITFGLAVTVIFYKADEFQKNGWAPPASWDDLFRPELCGRVAIPYINTAYATHALLMLGRGDMDAGIGRIKQLARCVPVFEPSSPKLEEKITLGEYLIGVHGTMRVIPITMKGFPIKFVYPKEGTMPMPSVISPVKNGPNPRLAQQWINWLLRPESQRILMEELAYGPVVRTLEVPREWAERGVPTPEIVQKLIRPDEATLVKNRKAWADAFDRAVAR